MLIYLVPLQSSLPQIPLKFLLPFWFLQVHSCVEIFWRIILKCGLSACICFTFKALRQFFFHILPLSRIQTESIYGAGIPRANCCNKIQVFCYCSCAFVVSFSPLHLKMSSHICTEKLDTADQSLDIGRTIVVQSSTLHASWFSIHV